MKPLLFYKISFRYLALFSILSLLSAFCYILYNSYKGDLNNYKQARIDELNISYNAIINLHQRTSLFLYETVINTPETWRILEQANSQDSSLVNQARSTLYQHLKSDYEQLISFDIRQLHFHLPNNHSFLRFHRPEKYGDNLSEARYSIAETNRLLIPHIGFEEGRIYNGFRYVFPITNEKRQHLGSVEVSINFNAIKKELNKLHPKEYAFYIRKDIVDKKVFESEKNNYCTSSLHDKLLTESCTKKSAHIEALNKDIKKKTHKAIEQFKSFSTICFCQKGFQIISFFPIKNVMGKNSAYIVAYENDNSIKYIYIKYAAIIFFTLLLLFFIANLLTLLRSNNKKLEENKKELIISNKTKDKFFSIIAHDIKGPVSSSVELIRLMKDNPNLMDEKKTKQSLAVIFTSLNDTYKLLNNLLQWSRSQRGTISFTPERLHLNTIVQQTIAPLLQLASNKEIEIVNLTKMSIWISADQDMLSTIIRNIVSNAIKFTPHHGTVRISTLDNTNTAPLYITIKISDTGIGIPKEYHANLLNIEKETSTKGTDNESGTGLGLILCQEFVNYHKGKLWFETKENKGTHFFFSIPLA